MNRKLTAVLLIAAAVLTNAAFTVLGASSTTPTSSRSRPPRSCRVPESQAAVSFWFAVHRRVLRLVRADRHRGRPALDPPRDAGRGAGRYRGRVRPGDRPVPLAPARARLRRRRHERRPCHRRRRTTRSRPPTASSATSSAETLGYLFTATWTLLVVAALHRRLAGRWFSVLGAGSAVLIARGRAVPARPAGRRHRQLRRLRALERLAGRLRRPPPASTARHGSTDSPAGALTAARG